MHYVLELQHRIMLAMVIAERAGQSEVSLALARIGGALDTILLDKAPGGRRSSSFGELTNAPAQEEPSAIVLPFRYRHPDGPGWQGGVPRTI